MNLLAETTPPELISIITSLYDCLFDSNKRFNALNGFTDVVDNGIVKFKGEDNCRKINLNYNGKKYEFGLFNYVRNNGNTIAVRNEETDSNFIQYVLDKFLKLEGGKIVFTHDGVTTGSVGKTKEACIAEIEIKAPQLIKVDGNKKSIDLGYLENGFQFEDIAFQSLIANFLEYAILRNNFKNSTNTIMIDNFKDLVEGYKEHIKNVIEINIRFSIQEAHKRFVWIADYVNGFTNSNCHYELVSKDMTTLNVVIHFEDKNKKNYYTKLKDFLPKNTYWNKAHKAGKSIENTESIHFNDPDLFTKIDTILIYLNENLGHKISNIKNEEHPVLNSPSIIETMSLNQILYGPPGTGKTYNSINKALEIINDDEVKLLDWSNRVNVKNLYDKKVGEGQIVFTTFHQNMSYEDFIEGIKPKKTNEGKVIYEIENGLFKKLCLKASEKKASETFEDSYSKFVEEVLNAGSIMLETPTQKKKFKVIINSNETAVAIPETEKATKMGVTKEMVRDYVINDVIRDWKPYTTAIGEYVKANYPFKVENIDNANKNFVIIIDEINRGNVSKIFGELITLIEESKREGNSEAIIGILPYSKQEFSVPKNVYILGTMNTADRSVEVLDTALRRRFDFVEMMPKYQLFESNDMRYQFNSMFAFDILEKINKRIEILLGRDHLIGHSFFILDEKETIDNKVKSAFYKNIIPLLQEYFYGDYNKIGLVLGSGFVTKIKVENHKDLFANDKQFNGNDYVGRETYNYSIAEFNDVLAFYNAIDILMNKTTSSETNE